MSIKSNTKLTVISPSSGWTGFNFREVWKFRDLLYLLVKRDFVAQYKQTILGPAWFVLQPLFLTVVFTVVFGKFASNPHRWPSSPSSLQLGTYYMELFFDLFFRKCEYHGQCRNLSKSLLSKINKPNCQLYFRTSGISYSNTIFGGYFLIYKFIVPTAEPFFITWVVLILP